MLADIGAEQGAAVNVPVPSARPASPPHYCTGLAQPGSAARDRWMDAGVSAIDPLLIHAAPGLPLALAFL